MSVEDELRDEIATLRGIAAADKRTANAVRMLINALEQHEMIYVWREY